VSFGVLVSFESVFQGFAGFFFLVLGFFFWFGLKGQILFCEENWAFQKGGICGVVVCVHVGLTVMPLFSVLCFVGKDSCIIIVLVILPVVVAHVVRRC
jgi:hypothetical protein